MREITGLIRAGLRISWDGLEALVDQNPRYRSVLNGIVGDWLEASQSRLAIPMSLRGSAQGGRVCIFAHGLCDSDTTWGSVGNTEDNYGSLLEADLDFQPLYLSYNSGLHISTNGRRLADLIRQLDDDSPEPIREIIFVGHSMGGLVVRSACHYGLARGDDWVARVRKVFFLGTPHLGTDLEKLGNLTSKILKVIPNPFTKAIAKLGDMRSAGIKDLRFGYLLDEDWEEQDPDALWKDNSHPVPLLAGVDYHLISANLAGKSEHFLARYFGDGVVPSRSAAGKSFRRARTLPFPASRLIVVKGLSHVRLTNHEKVYRHIRDAFRPKYL